MSPLSEAARKQLTDTVRTFQDAHEDDLPKCDEAWQRLYPDQVDLFKFRQVWNEVTRAREIEAKEAARKEAMKAELRVEIEAEGVESSAEGDDPPPKESPQRPQGTAEKEADDSLRPSATSAVEQPYEADQPAA